MLQSHKHLRVEFLLKTDSGYPKDTGVWTPWQPLRIPFATTPVGQLYQSPPSPIPGDLGRSPSHQSHILGHRDTYGQAQICSKGHQGSSVDRPCQISFHGASSGMYGIRYLRAINYILMSLCTTRLTRESKIDPRQPRKEKKTSAPITPIRPLPGD